MALRRKTIRYPFPVETAKQTSTTRTDFSAVTVYIPETTSRTFLSVTAEVITQSADDATPNISAFTLGCKLGAVAFQDQTRSPTLTSSGACQRSYCFAWTFTSYWNTNFGSGTSQTCQIGFAFTGAARINTSAMLIVTYEYDDAAQTTRIKTVCIPLDSAILTTCTNSLQTLDTTPNLSTFLPEASKTYRQIWFEIEGNEALSSSINFTLGYALDAEAEVNDGTHYPNTATSGGRYIRFNWVRNDMTTNATHTFKIRSTVTGEVIWPTVRLWVTYEYNHSTSTTILQSLQLVVGSQVGAVEGYTSTDGERAQLSLDVMEPGTITLVQSAVAITTHQATTTTVANTLAVAAGSQSERTYTGYANVNNNPFVCQFRVDSGAAMGAGMTLARGANTITVDYRTTVSMAMVTGGSAMLYLNYTSDKHASGDGVHARTLHTLLGSNSNTNTFGAYFGHATAIIAVPESGFYRTLGVSALLNGHPNPFTGEVAAISEQAQIQAGEAEGKGWRDFGLFAAGGAQPVNAVAFRQILATQVFKRYPNDPDVQRLDPLTSRVWRTTAKAGGMNFNVAALITYHLMSFTVSGNAVGYTGDGSGLTVKIHRSDTGEVVATGTTAVGGSYAVTVHDNTVLMYAEIRQDGTHLGRSDDGYAA